MRRLYLVMALAILIQACAGLPFNGVRPPTNTPVSTAALPATFTPVDTPTSTITPTLTASPTIVQIATVDPDQPTATATLVPVPIFIGKFTVTPFAWPTAVQPGFGFLSVEVTDKKIYWGSCKPHTTRITAKVENPEDVFSVIIFVQVKSAFKEDYTPWTTGNAMNSHRDGTFSYTLNANTTRGHNHYKSSWILFQLVATDDKGEVIGRTKIYTNQISLSPCM